MSERETWSDGIRSSSKFWAVVTTGYKSSKSLNLPGSLCSKYSKMASLMIPSGCSGLWCKFVPSWEKMVSVTLFLGLSLLMSDLAMADAGRDVARLLHATV